MIGYPGVLVHLLTLGALAAPCPWQAGDAVEAHHGGVWVGDDAYEVTGKEAREAFGAVLTACGVPEQASFERWRANRRSVNALAALSPPTVFVLPWVALSAGMRRKTFEERLTAGIASTTPDTERFDARFPAVDGRLIGAPWGADDGAVVIGLEDYAFVPDVPYARRDGDAFASFALYTRGIPPERVVRLSSGNADQIRAAVREVATDMGPGGTVWIYFSGHGAADPATGQRLLLGDDVRSDPASFASRSISVLEVEELASAAGGRTFMMLDTCFSGLGRGGDSLLAGTRFVVPAWAGNGDHSTLWAAAGPDELARPLDGAAHGAFTYFALGAMRGWADGEFDGARDGVVSPQEAVAYVARAFSAFSVRDQHPQWTGDAGAPAVLTSGVSEVGPLP